MLCIHPTSNNSNLNVKFLKVPSPSLSECFILLYSPNCLSYLMPPKTIIITPKYRWSCLTYTTHLHRSLNTRIENCLGDSWLLIIMVGANNNMEIFFVLT